MYYLTALGVLLLWIAVASGLDLDLAEMIVGGIGAGLAMPTKKQYDRLYLGRRGKL